MIKRKTVATFLSTIAIEKIHSDNIIIMLILIIYVFEFVIAVLSLDWCLIS